MADVSITEPIILDGWQTFDGGGQNFRYNGPPTDAVVRITGTHNVLRNLGIRSGKADFGILYEEHPETKSTSINRIEFADVKDNNATSLAGLRIVSSGDAQVDQLKIDQVHFTGFGSSVSSDAPYALAMNFNDCSFQHYRNVGIDLYRGEFRDYGSFYGSKEDSSTWAIKLRDSVPGNRPSSRRVVVRDMQAEIHYGGFLQCEAADPGFVVRDTNERSLELSGTGKIIMYTPGRIAIDWQTSGRVLFGGVLTFDDCGILIHREAQFLREPLVRYTKGTTELPR